MFVSMGVGMGIEYLLFVPYPVPIYYIYVAVTGRKQMLFRSRLFEKMATQRASKSLSCNSCSYNCTQYKIIHKLHTSTSLFQL